MDSESNHAVANISFGEALSASFQPLFKNLKIALNLAIFPAVAVSLLVTLNSLFVPTVDFNNLANPPEYSTLSIIGQITVGFVGLLVSVQYFVAWIRFQLNGEYSVWSTFLFNVKKRHWITLGKSLLLVVLSYILLIITVTLFGAVFGVLLGIVGGVGGSSSSGVVSSAAVIGGVGGAFIAFILISLLSLRFCYVIPAAALDEPYSFIKSWKQTRRQSWRLFGVFFVLGLIYMVIFAIFTGIFWTMLIGILSLLGETISFQSVFNIFSKPDLMIFILPLYFIAMLLHYMLYIPLINLISYCYRKNTGWINNEEIAERFS